MYKNTTKIEDIELYDLDGDVDDRMNTNTVRNAIRNHHKPMYESYGEGPSPQQGQHQNKVMISEAPQVQQEPVLNCLDVANHIQNCPVCSKLYNNNNNVNVLLIIISILVIICLILGNKLLNSNS